VDFFGVAFALAGILVFLMAKQRPWLASIPWVVAIFVKYSLISAPAAAFLLLAWRREWRAAWKLAGAAALMTIGWFAYLQATTKGWFGFNMFRAHPDPSSVAHAIWFYGSLFPYFRIAPFSNIRGVVATSTILLVALYFVCSFLVKTKEARYLVLYAAICAVVSFVTGAKLGSNHNHLVEFAAALCVCAGVGYSSLREGKRWALAFVALAMLAFVAKTPRVWRHDVFAYERPGAEAGCPDFYAFVKQYPGQRILSSNVGAVLLSGKPVLVSNPFVYSQLVEHRGWEDTIANNVRNRDYDLLALDGDMQQLRTERFGWSPAFVDAVEKNYIKTHHFVCMQAYGVFERKADVQHP
jgi:hypothetical protein